MNNRNTGMIATIVTAVICGCCALFACIMGIGTITGSGTFTVGGTSGQTPPAYGYVMLCLSFLMILVPVAVGFFTLRKKPGAEDSMPPTDAPAE
jgi:hypothetical protein